MESDQESADPSTTLASSGAHRKTTDAEFNVLASFLDTFNALQSTKEGSAKGWKDFWPKVRQKLGQTDLTDKQIRSWFRYNKSAVVWDPVEEKGVVNKKGAKSNSNAVLNTDYLKKANPQRALKRSEIYMNLDGKKKLVDLLFNREYSLAKISWYAYRRKQDPEYVSSDEDYPDSDSDAEGSDNLGDRRGWNKRFYAEYPDLERLDSCLSAVDFSKVVELRHCALNMRMELAEKMLKKETQQIQDKVEDLYQSERDRVQTLKKGNTVESAPVPLRTNEEYQRSLDAVPSFSSKTLKYLSHESGCWFALLGVGPQPANGGKIGVLFYSSEAIPGKPSLKNFWPEFENVVGNKLTDYGRVLYPEEIRAKRALDYLPEAAELSVGEVAAAAVVNVAPPAIAPPIVPTLPSSGLVSFASPAQEIPLVASAANTYDQGPATPHPWDGCIDPALLNKGNSLATPPRYRVPALEGLPPPPPPPPPDPAATAALTLSHHDHIRAIRDLPPTNEPFSSPHTSSNVSSSPPVAATNEERRITSPNKRSCSSDNEEPDGGEQDELSQAEHGDTGAVAVPVPLPVNATSNEGAASTPHTYQLSTHAIHVWPNPNPNAPSNRGNRAGSGRGTGRGRGRGQGRGRGGGAKAKTSAVSTSPNPAANGTLTYTLKGSALGDPPTDAFAMRGRQARNNDGELLQALNNKVNKRPTRTRKPAPPRAAELDMISGGGSSKRKNEGDTGDSVGKKRARRA